jgi:hypothetical protein
MYRKASLAEGVRLLRFYTEILGLEVTKELPDGAAPALT